MDYYYYRIDWSESGSGGKSTKKGRIFKALRGGGWVRHWTFSRMLLIKSSTSPLLFTPTNLEMVLTGNEPNLCACVCVHDKRGAEASFTY